MQYTQYMYPYMNNMDHLDYICNKLTIYATYRPYLQYMQYMVIKIITINRVWYRFTYYTNRALLKHNWISKVHIAYQNRCNHIIHFESIPSRYCK